MRTTPRKPRKLAGRKSPVSPKPQARPAARREKPRNGKPPLVLTQSEHLQGLWVTLGLADVAD